MDCFRAWLWVFLGAALLKVSALLKQTFFHVVAVKVYKKEMAEVVGHLCVCFLVLHE